MKIKISKKKMIVILNVILILACFVVIYQNIDFNSIITYNDDKIAAEQDDSKESESFTKDDVVSPDTILVDGPDGFIDYNNVTFSWSGIDDVTKTNHLLYSYKLENFDSEWSFWTTLDTKKYTKLPNGNYTFLVKSIDESGNIDQTPVNISFIVSVDLEKTELVTFYVYWPILTRNVELDDFYFVKKNLPFEKVLSISQQNLKQINFKISWEDDFTSPIFHFGKDVLTCKIKLNDEIIFNEQSIGQGTFSYNISDINDKPSIFEIKAESLSMANQTIGQFFGSELTDEDFSINIDVKVRELRLLPRIRDKGNDFKLEISYDYYEPQITSLEDNPPETSITGGPKDTTFKTDISFSWNGTDDFSTFDKLRYSYMLEPIEKTWSDWTFDTLINYYNLDYGEYTFFVRAMDDMDNIDPTPAKRTFIIEEPESDDIDPIVEILSGPSDVISETTFTFKWIGSDDTTPTNSLKYRYKLDGKDEDWSEWDYITEITFADIFNGFYTFLVDVKDSAGNYATAKRSFTVLQWNNSRFVSKIVEFIPGESASFDIEKLLGGPVGCGEYCGSFDVLRLGNSGILTVGFDVTIVDNSGYDFIIFENPFFINDNTDEVFAELAYVEVSSDNISYARFPCISTTENPVGNKGININNVTNLAGAHPVLVNVDENNLNPFNPDEAGGDAFDLDDLADDPLVLSGLVDLNNINYIRLIDIPGDGSCLDSLGNPIYDPTEGTLIDGADIDAVSVINYIVKN